MQLGANDPWALDAQWGLSQPWTPSAQPPSQAPQTPSWAYRGDVDPNWRLAWVVWGGLRERGRYCDRQRGQLGPPRQAGAWHQGATQGEANRHLWRWWGRLLLGCGRRRWWGLGLWWGWLLGARLGEEGVGQLLLQRQGVHGHGLWREEGIRQRRTQQ